MLESFALDAEVFNNPLIKWQLVALRLMGFIFARSDSFQILHFCRGILVSISVFLLFCAQIRSIWLHSDDLEKLSPALCASITYVNVCTRIVAFYCYRERYNQILTNAKFALKRVLAKSLPKETQIYNSYIKYITTMNYTIIGPFIVAGLLICSEGVYFIIHQSQQWTLQRQEENSTKAKGMNHLFVLYCTGSLSENFFFTFILPYYMVLIGGYSLFTWQTFNVAIMRYISFRIDVVKFRLANISKYAGNLLKELHPNKNRKLPPSHPILLKYVLVSCVEDLTEIKCFAGDYEFVSNVTVFIESSTTSALLCGQLYIMTKDCTGIYALWSVVTIGMLWNYYWHANEILYKSHEITNALYSFDWYAVPPPLQKDIAIFMGASMRSIIMKSGFIYILTTSYRYFTLLRNFAK